LKQIAPTVAEADFSDAQETLSQKEFTRKDDTQVSLLFAAAPQIEAPGHRIGLAIKLSPT
jgi:type III secretory pathway lipoprotein EscJ